jgi:hypothetical protein
MVGEETAESIGLGEWLERSQNHQRERGQFGRKQWHHLVDSKQKRPWQRQRTKSLKRQFPDVARRCVLFGFQKSTCHDGLLFLLPACGGCTTLDAADRNGVVSSESAAFTVQKLV